MVQLAGRRGGQPVWTVIISDYKKTKSRRGWEECDDYQEKSCKNKDVSGNGNKDGWNGGDKRSKSREGEHVGHRHCCKSKKNNTGSAEDIVWVVHYCTLSMTECRVGTPYMRRNFIDGPPKASVDQSGPSFLQKLHIGYVPGPQKNFGDPSTYF